MGFRFCCARVAAERVRQREQRRDGEREAIQVVCCTDSNTLHRKDEGIWCESARNYWGAKELCEKGGYRLCTVNEILTMGPTYTALGCNFDVFLVWTSDECHPSDSAAHASQLNVFGSESNGEMVSVKLSKWGAGVVSLCVLAMLLLAILRCKLCSKGTRSNYAKVASADSEELAEDELRAINVE